MHWQTPMAHYIPYTRDGVITGVDRGSQNLLIECKFDVNETVAAIFRDEPAAIRFAARSRIARLGIDLLPTEKIKFDGTNAKLILRVEPITHAGRLLDILPKVLVPGIPVGRLVACPESQRLNAQEVYEAYMAQEFKLPASFSIDARDFFTIRPHRVVYELTEPVTEQMLLKILLREEGKALLNRIQQPKRVDNIVVPPGGGVITSCTMYLHRHYVVLTTADTDFGRHTQAQVLDPVTTRGRQVFLEIHNPTSVPIVNPIVSAHVFRALPGAPPQTSRRSLFTNHDYALAAQGTEVLQYESVKSAFATQPTNQTDNYLVRPVGIVRKTIDNSNLEEHVEWSCCPPPEAPLLPKVARANCPGDERSTSCLAELVDQSGATVLLRYFPNLYEHLDLLSALRRGAIRRIVFEHASFEHGPYLSARDQSRLADFHDLGAEVFWCNSIRSHVAAHVYRGRRGFFCRQECIDQFMNSLMISFYGSSVDLPASERSKLDRLITKLSEFFGPDLALLTGGGPGVMQHVAEVGQRNNISIGANYLEIESQPDFQVADFYQVFQETSRHMRQRWFEVASFAIFCIGGLGTLEEVGMTLTDIKLGVTDRIPLIFFGEGASGSLYWKSLKDQLCTIHGEGRGPEWLKDHILVTDDPEEVISFYRSTLEIG